MGHLGACAHVHARGMYNLWRTVSRVFSSPRRERERQCAASPHLVLVSIHIPSFSQFSPVLFSSLFSPVIDAARPSRRKLMDGARMDTEYIRLLQRQDVFVVARRRAEDIRTRARARIYEHRNDEAREFFAGESERRGEFRWKGGKMLRQGCNGRRARGKEIVSIWEAFFCIHVQVAYI